MLPTLQNKIIQQDIEGCKICRDEAEAPQQNFKTYFGKEVCQEITI